MDKKIQQAYLYDFYGEILNEHQRKIYEDVVYNDLSLSEIAEEEGISRQGVSDIIRRVDQKLLGYEQKLHLLERFLAIKSEMTQMHQQLEKLLADQQLNQSQKESVTCISQLASKILEQL
ncbi:YlxM family DNA-binding protein [Agathobacter ruminis]|uniref:UPF0122 protein CSX02_10045 n=1 Tax=Agathobacter ruminis TaxID=1712665 RepID=A0A2G3E164_9FIRM|nr:sigma factor-like helix-turn-helix DNA-binding protein [Agathobacter ruminis]MDC7302734.1 DNA-binding protein [Agathobacter ruminis]PHU37026.1 DNA-binding protein [Agathobacter ruminis]